MSREDFEGVAAMAGIKRDELEKPRTLYAKKALTERGWRITPGPDEHSFTVFSPTGQRFNFWPYTGWYAGKVKGRGIHNMIRHGERKEQPCQVK